MVVSTKTMSRYTFLTIQTEEVMNVPGKIIEVYTNRPFNSERFVALVELDETAVEGREVADLPSDFASDSEGVTETPEPERIEDLTVIDGVGPATAENLAEAGYDQVPKLRAANREALRQIKGVGANTAKNLKDYVE